MLTDPTLLAHLLATADPKEPVTLAATAPARTWLKLFTEQQGGPEVLGTKQCAERFGFSQAQWRRWAEEIPGAVHVGKAWRIPRDAAQAHADRMMKRDRSTEDGRAPSAIPQRRGGNYGKFRSLKQGYRPPEQGV